jgi:hypothetical protein
MAVFSTTPYSPTSINGSQGAIGSGTHSWKNQNKNATDLLKNLDQVLHYLTATGLRLALLLNFGTRPLQFKRIIR